MANGIGIGLDVLAGILILAGIVLLFFGAGVLGPGVQGVGVEEGGGGSIKLPFGALISLMKDAMKEMFKGNATREQKHMAAGVLLVLSGLVLALASVIPYALAAKG